MTKYIKMTDAITTTWMIFRGMGYAAEDNPDMVKTVAAVFDTAPAADVVEVRHGRWIKFSRGDVCSECQYQTGRYEHCGNYCPNCGAKMDEGKDEASAGPYDLLYEEGGPDA